MEWLINAQSNGDNNIEDVVNVVGKDGKTPLHLAAAAGKSFFFIVVPFSRFLWP